MNFPVFPEKFRLPALYGAADIIRYRQQLGRMPELNGPHSILFCLERGLPWRLRWRIPVRRAGGMNGDLFALKKPHDRVGIMTGFGGGSPMTAELAEEFAAMGVRRMVLLTWGGMLQKEMQAGDIVVVERAIRDEGTSYHYLPPARTVDGSPALAGALQAAIRERGGSSSRGVTWTTDAPYRESVEEIRQYQAEGVKTVEMETAGLFTIGQVRGVETAAVVVGMDSLAELRWQVPERLDGILRSLELAYAAAVDVLKKS